MGSYHTFMIVGEEPSLGGEKEPVTRQRVLDQLNSVTATELGWEHGPWIMLDPDQWNHNGSAVNMLGPIFFTSIKSIPTATIEDAMNQMDWPALGYYNGPPLLITSSDYTDGPIVVDWEDNNPTVIDIEPVAPSALEHR